VSHRVRFEGWAPIKDLMTEEQATALIDLLYRGENAEFILHGHLPEGMSLLRSKGLRGRHCLEFGLNRIHLVPQNILKYCRESRPVGGNRRCDDPRLGAGLVLAHELQHANQHLLHRQGEMFWGRKPFTKYLSWPHEREARQFADDNRSIVAATLGVELPKEMPELADVEATLEDIVTCFGELEEISIVDLREELRDAGLNNPVNIQRARERLLAAGVRVLSGSIS